MRKRMNNKGYMLIEIILASAIAMGVAYFITELTIKLKNKNDDLVVKTLVSTDQAIMYNTIMEDIYSGNEFKCSNININNNVFKYKDFTNVVSDYATISKMECSDDNNISIYIPMTVKQLPKDDFSVVINANNSSSGSSGGGSSTGDTEEYANEGVCATWYTGSNQDLMSGGEHVTYENNTGNGVGSYEVTIIADSGYKFESGGQFIQGKYNNRWFKTRTCELKGGLRLRVKATYHSGYDSGVEWVAIQVCKNGNCGAFSKYYGSGYYDATGNDHIVINVYGIPKKGYAMKSCTEASPCQAFSVSPPYTEPLFSLAPYYLDAIQQ